MIPIVTVRSESDDDDPVVLTKGELKRIRARVNRLEALMWILIGATAATSPPVVSAFGY